MQDFCFLCEAEVTAGSNELVHTELHIGFRSGIEGTIISKEEVSDTVCHDLDFGLEVKQLAICTVFDADSDIAVSEGIGQHSGEHEAEQCRCKDTALIDAVGDWKREGCGGLAVVLDP